ncbi:MAG: hypothetical protein EXS59_01170 [Candidatus Taylorbacteria bacterium]|nr:hypothetical protein [Candidatus Taylorbacteria bacterium]
MKIAIVKLVPVLSVTALVIPFFAFAAISFKVSTQKQNSRGHEIGVVPYYAYGYDVNIQAEKIVEPILPPVAPKLPIAGRGGASVSHFK